MIDDVLFPTSRASRQRSPRQFCLLEKAPEQDFTAAPDSNSLKDSCSSEKQSLQSMEDSPDSGSDNPFDAFLNQ